MKESVKRLFASTSCVRLNIDSILTEYWDSHLTGIELGVANCWKPSSMDACLKNSNARFLIHNYFPPPVEPFVLNLASQDAFILERSMSMCKNAISICEKLKAPFYSVHAGFRANLSPASLGRQAIYKEIYPYKLAYQTFVNSVRELVAYGTLLDVDLLIEPNVVPTINLVSHRNELLLIAEADEVEQLISDVNHPRLGILLDTGHLNVTSRTLGFCRMDFITQVSPYIRAFHVHDNDSTADTHTPVGPGSWVLDVLKRKEFAKLPIIVEAKFDSVADLRKHMDWLQSELSNNNNEHI